MSDSIKECDFATIDFSKQSLIIQTLKSIRPNEAQVSEYLRLLDHAMASMNGDFVLMSVGSDVSFDTFKTTIRFFKGIRKIERKYAQSYRKAFVVDIAIRDRLLLPIFNIFARPIAPRVYVDTVEEGIDLASIEMGIPFY